MTRRLQDVLLADMKINAVGVEVPILNLYCVCVCVCVYVC